MKKVIIFVSFLVILTSCDISDPEGDKIGFEFLIGNKSGIEHDNVKITIGGIKDGQFIGTESYTFPKILLLSDNWPDTKGNQHQSIALDQNRWNPNLDLIRAIPSERAYFTFQLEGGEEILLYDSYERYNGELVSVAIPEGRIIKNDDGDLSITIEKDNVLAHLRSDRDTLP